ncbi:MAG: response regulator transcription factor [Deltaproteobacteria bacterium]|nr:response regulator transcription factor [Deltaproteobacteria bacterium]
MQVSKITTLVLDNHRLFRAGVKRVLAPHGIEVIAEAETGREAIDRALQFSPDVVIMDVALLQGSGIEVIKELVARRPLQRVLCVSSLSGMAVVQTALEAGAHGYALKSATEEELVEAVRQVHSGNVYLQPELKEADRDRSSLTERELQAIRHAAQGFSNAEIGDAMGIETRTARGHISRALKKLGYHRRTQLVIYAFATGIASLDHSTPTGNGDRELERAGGGGDGHATAASASSTSYS